jgi:tRNA 2-selenouridine synthase
VRHIVPVTDEGQPQPSQKMFDSLVWERLRGFDGSRPVYVESESRKIGLVQVNGTLLERMRSSECIVLDVPVRERVRFLMQEYGHFLEDPESLKAKLSCLKDLYGGEVLTRWLALAEARDWHTLVPDLLESHYDPAYRRSMMKNFLAYHHTVPLRLERLDEAALDDVAAGIVAPLAHTEGL